MSKKLPIVADLSNKSVSDLRKLYKEFRLYLAQLRMKLSLGQQKDTSELSKVKKTLARICFFMNNTQAKN